MSNSDSTNQMKLKSGVSADFVLERVIDVLVSGEDKHPLAGAGVALRREDGKQMLTITDTNGLARFGGLEAEKKYKLCLHKRDQDAWELMGHEAIGDQRAAETKKDSWEIIEESKGEDGFKHIVQPGECVASIAESYGHFPETIWEFGSNGKLKDLRKDPNILMASDVLTIPPLRMKEEEVELYQKYSVIIKGVPEKLMIQFMEGGEPRANESYVIEIDDELLSEEPSKTDDKGMIDIWTRPGASRAKIIFTKDNDEYCFDLGHLDPVTEIVGVQQRLINLGFYRGIVDGIAREELNAAIRDFQRSIDPDKEPSGKLDKNLQDALVKEFGR